MESNVFSADEDLSVSVLQFFKEMMAKPHEFQDKVSQWHNYNNYIYIYIYGDDTLQVLW